MQVRKMDKFPKGTPPELVVKDMELLFSRPEYKTNKRVVHWCGGKIPDNWTIDELLKTIKEKDNPEDLAFWANHEKNTFTLAHVDLSDPENG